MHTLRVVRTTQEMGFKSFKVCQNSCVLVAIFCLTNRFDFIDGINDSLDSVLKTDRSIDCRRKIVEETVFNLNDLVRFLNDLVRFWGSLNCKVGFDPLFTFAICSGPFSHSPSSISATFVCNSQSNCVLFFAPTYQRAQKVHVAWSSRQSYSKGTSTARNQSGGVSGRTVCVDKSTPSSTR